MVPMEVPSSDGQYLGPSHDEPRKAVSTTVMLLHMSSTTMDMHVGACIVHNI